MALRSSVVVRDAALYQVSYLQKHRQQGNTTITHSYGDIYHKMLSDIVQTGQRHWWPTKLFFFKFAISNVLSTHHFCQVFVKWKNRRLLYSNIFSIAKTKVKENLYICVYSTGIWHVTWKYIFTFWNAYYVHNFGYIFRCLFAHWLKSNKICTENETRSKYIITKMLRVALFGKAGYGKHSLLYINQCTVQTLWGERLHMDNECHSYALGKNHIG